MKRRALALLFLAACTRRPPTPTDTPDAAPIVEAAAPVAVVVPDAGPPLELGVDGGLAALLSGEASAKRLPELATDNGEEIDRDLRKRLTTVELPEHRGLGSLGDVADVPARPKGTVAIENITATSPVSDADRVVASLQPRFRNCYESGRNETPSMAGKLVVATSMDKGGIVTEAYAASNVGLSPLVTSCVLGVIKRSVFGAPGGTGSTLTIPITFTPPK